MLRLVIYLLMACTWVYSYVYDWMYVQLVSTKGDRLLKVFYLTYLNFAVQTVYSLLCVVRAVVDQRSEVRDVGPHRAHPAPPVYYETSRLHRFCDFIYATVVFPIGMVVVSLFWTLYYIDRKLVFPEHLDEIIPAWLNSVLHVAPAPFALVDSLLVCHRYPDRLTGMATVTALAVCYEITLVIVRLTCGYWLYGIFDVLSPIGKALFFLGVAVAVNAMYLLGDCYSRVIWGTASHPPSTSDVGHGQSAKVKVN